MAEDPLTSVANQVAPAPTNFFSDGVGQNLLARYSRDRRLAESSEGVAARSRNLATAARGLEQDQWSRDREAFDALTRDQREEEILQQKEADAMRGDFLASLAQDLNTEDPEYHRKAGALFANLPPSLQKDPAVKGVMESMARRADAAYQNRLMLQRAEETQKDQLERIARRSKEMGALTEDDIKEAPLDPETGKPDQDWLQRRGALRLREAELQDFGKKEGIRHQNRLELFNIRNLDREESRAQQAMEDVVKQDRAAFPSAVEGLRAAMLSENPKWKRVPDVALENDPRYADAKAADKDRFMSAVDEALRAPSRAAYVEGVRGLDEEARAARGALWDYVTRFEAQKRQGFTGPPASAATVQDITARRGPQRPVVPPELKGKPDSQFGSWEADGFEYRQMPDGTTQRRPIRQ